MSFKKNEGQEGKTGSALGVSTIGKGEGIMKA
jgi:hypothetical protein